MALRESDGQMPRGKLVGGLQAEVAGQQLVAVGRRGAVQPRTVKARFRDLHHNLAPVDRRPYGFVGEHFREQRGVSPLAEQHFHALDARAVAVGLERELIVTGLGNLDFREKDIVVGRHVLVVFVGQPVVRGIVFPGLAVIVHILECEITGLLSYRHHLERHGERPGGRCRNNQVADIQRDTCRGGSAVEHHVIFSGCN